MMFVLLVVEVDQTKQKVLYAIIFWIITYFQSTYKQIFKANFIKNKMTNRFLRGGALSLMINSHPIGGHFIVYLKVLAMNHKEVRRGSKNFIISIWLNKWNLLLELVKSSKQFQLYARLFRRIKKILAHSEVNVIMLSLSKDVII